MAFTPTRIISQPEQEKGFLQKTSDFLGNSALGKRIGWQLFKGSEEYSNLGSVIESNKQMEQKVLEQIQKGKAIGKDTSKLEQALNQLRISTTQAEQAYREQLIAQIEDGLDELSKIQTPKLRLVK